MGNSQISTTRLIAIKYCLHTIAHDDIIKHEGKAQAHS